MFDYYNYNLDDTKNYTITLIFYTNIIQQNHIRKQIMIKNQEIGKHNLKKYLR